MDSSSVRLGDGGADSMETKEDGNEENETCESEEVAQPWMSNEGVIVQGDGEVVETSDGGHQNEDESNGEE